MSEPYNGHGKNLVQVAERYRMKPPVSAPSRRFHESADMTRIHGMQGKDIEEACQRDLAKLLDKNRTFPSSQHHHRHPGSIEETLGLVFAEHVGRKNGSGVSDALAKEAEQALKTMASVVAAPGSSRQCSKKDYIRALGALIVGYDTRGRIDVDTALHYLYE